MGNGLWSGQSGFWSSGSGGGGGGTGVLSLTNSSVLESATVGTTVGALAVVGHPSGPTGWTFVDTTDPDNKFVISGASLNLSATVDYDAATFHSVTITASKSGQTDIVRVFSISVINVLEVTLAVLALDNATLPEDSAATVNITGASPGSAIAVQTGALPTGMSLNSAARTIIGTPTTPGGYNFTLRETHSDGANSPRDTALSMTISAVAMLNALALDDVDVPEDVAATINITGTTAGSTLTVQTGSLPAGMTLNSASRTITGTPTTPGGYNFTLRETLAGAGNSPRDTAASINVAATAITLGALVLDDLSFAVGAADSGDIIGKTSGSTVTLVGSLPSGLTLNLGAMTWTWSGTGTVATGNFTLRETLAGASNSPRDSVQNWAITTAGEDANLWMGALVTTTAQNVYPPALDGDFSNPYLLSTDTVKLQISSDVNFSVITDEETVELGTGALTWTILGGVTSGQHYFRERMERGANYGPWSNTAKVGDAAAPVLSVATGTQTGATTANLSVTSSEGEGTIYWTVLLATAPAPTIPQFLAGATGGFDEGEIAAASGANAASATGLAEATAYKVHFYQRDLALRDSNLIASASFTTADATGPLLSSAAAVPAGPIMGFLSASTNDATGTFYWYVSTSATPPSVTDIKSGAGAVAFGSQSVTATGMQRITAGGLTPNVTYYGHYLHADAGGNDSLISTAGPFTTLNLPQASGLRHYSEPVLGTMYVENTKVTPVVANDDRVGFLPDFSGYGNDFSSSLTAGSKPLYKAGTPDYINFDGTNYYLWKDNPSFNLWSAGSFTVAVAVRGTPATARALLANTNNASNTQRVDALRSDSTTASTAAAFYRSDGNSPIINSLPFKTGAWDSADRVVVLVDNGSSITGYVDGVAGSPVTYTRGAHVLTLNRLSLGAFYGSTFATAFSGRVHAVAIWPGVVLNASEVAQATTALATIQGRTI